MSLLPKWSWAGGHGFLVCFWQTKPRRKFNNHTFEELGPGGGRGDNTMKNLSTLRQKRVTTMQNKELQALSDKKGDNNAK
jgi:hypothetical protein